MDLVDHPTSNMAANPITELLPQEVLELVIDFLHDDRASLQAFCLTSWAFVPSCRKYLHDTVVVRSMERSHHALRQFHAFAITCPHLLEYIKSFSFVNEWYLHSDLSQVLHLLPALREFKLDYRCTSNPELISALTPTISSNQLTHLHLGHIREFPVSLLGFCRVLRSLSLLSVHMVGFAEEMTRVLDPQQGNPRPQLHSLHLTLSPYTCLQITAWLLHHNCTFDISQLERFSTIVDDIEEYEPIFRVIESTATSLQYLEFEPPLDCASLLHL